MVTHHFTEHSSKRSHQVIEDNYTNQERKPKYKKEFRNKITQEKFVTNEVQIMKYKRNKIITMFFDTYSSYSKFSLIEVGFDFEVTSKASDVLRIVKRNIARLNQDFLGYIWLIDKGTENATMHFHLVVASNKLCFKGKRLPKEMQFKFYDKKIHSSFVKNNEKLKQYLLKKKIYFVGKRKRVYGYSRNFIK
jgi:hypothetical protein